MKDSYWHALFDRLRKRMKAQKAIIAVARMLLKVVYKTLDTLTPYKEKGIAHFLDLQSKAAMYTQITGKTVATKFVNKTKRPEKVIE